MKGKVEPLTCVSEVFKWPSPHHHKYQVPFTAWQNLSLPATFFCNFFFSKSNGAARHFKSSTAKIDIEDLNLVLSHSPFVRRNKTTRPKT